MPARIYGKIFTISGKDHAPYEVWEYWGETYFAYPEYSSDYFDPVAVDAPAPQGMPFVFQHSTPTAWSDDVSSDQIPYVITPNTGKRSRWNETALLKDGYMILYFDRDAETQTSLPVDKDFIPYGEANGTYPYNSLITYRFTPDFEK